MASAVSSKEISRMKFGAFSVKASTRAPAAMFLPFRAAHQVDERGVKHTTQREAGRDCAGGTSTDAAATERRIAAAAVVANSVASNRGHSLKVGHAANCAHRHMHAP